MYEGTWISLFSFQIFSADTLCVYCVCNDNMSLVIPLETGYSWVISDYYQISESLSQIILQSILGSDGMMTNWMTDNWLTTDWLLTDCWLIAWRFELERWRLTALDNLAPKGQTDKVTFLGSCRTGAKKICNSKYAKAIKQRVIREKRHYERHE